MRVTRRSLLAGSAATAGLLSLIGCEGAVESTGNSRLEDGILTVGADTGANNLFVENWNTYNPTVGAAPGMPYILQTLHRISLQNNQESLPNLAESVTYEEKGTVATYTLRQGVTWTDGEAFDADDAIYSFNKIFGKPTDEPGNLAVFLRYEPEKVDDHTVRLTYNFPNSQQDTNLSLFYPMYPAHIFADMPDEEQKTFVMKKPVGTGPFTLKSFDPQRVVYQIRDDYWGEKIPHVKEVHFVPEGTPAVVQSDITKGSMDWAEGGGPGVQKQFLEMAETNSFTFFPDGGSRGVLINHVKPTKGETTEAILGENLDLRKALRGAVDPEVIQSSVNIGYPIPSPCYLDLHLYQDVIPEEYNQPLAQDAEGAKAALESSGFTVDDSGNLSKDGTTYPLTLLYDIAQPQDTVAAPILVEQWREVLGLEVKLEGVPNQEFGERLPRSQFTLAIQGIGFANSAYNAYQAFLRELRTDEKQLAGVGNQGRFDIGEEADVAAHALKEIDPSDAAKTKELVAVIATAMVEQVGAIPYQGGGVASLMSTTNWTGWPTLEDSDYAARADYSSGVRVLEEVKPAES